MIDITGVDLVKFAQKVYDLSLPQGLGFLHFRAGGLDEATAKDIVAGSSDDRIALDMDYVDGRACKMVVFKKDGRLQIRDAWYDHTDEQLRELLTHFKINVGQLGVHNPSCNCTKCRS